MTDEIAMRMGNARHHELSTALSRLFEQVAHVFRTLNAIQYAAPWDNSCEVAKRHAGRQRTGPNRERALRLLPVSKPTNPGGTSRLAIYSAARSH